MGQLKTIETYRFTYCRPMLTLQPIEESFFVSSQLLVVCGHLCTLWLAPASLPVPTWSSGGPVSSHRCLLIMTSAIVDEGSTLIQHDLILTNYTCNIPVSREVHILRYCGSECHHIFLAGHSSTCNTNKLRAIEQKSFQYFIFSTNNIIYMFYLNFKNFVTLNHSYKLE